MTSPPASLVRFRNRLEQRRDSRQQHWCSIFDRWRLTNTAQPDCDRITPGLQTIDVIDRDKLPARVIENWGFTSLPSASRRSGALSLQPPTATSLLQPWCLQNGAVVFGTEAYTGRHDRANRVRYRRHSTVLSSQMPVSISRSVTAPPYYLSSSIVTVPVSECFLLPAHSVF